MYLHDAGVRRFGYDLWVTHDLLGIEYDENMEYKIKEEVRNNPIFECFIRANDDTPMRLKLTTTYRMPLADVLILAGDHVHTALER